MGKERKRYEWRPIYVKSIGGISIRTLIDTNIFIYRESDHVIPENLQELNRILNQLKVEILVHPDSMKELKRDSNEDRKRVALSKARAYQILDSAPDQNRDSNFLSIVGHPSGVHDETDNALIFSVYKNAVDFLITEDKGIQKKAGRLGIKERVLSLEEARDFFNDYLPKEKVSHPPAIIEEYVYNLDINDPFFDSLKKNYEEFEGWFQQISRGGRKCWVHLREDRTIGALLIYKIEDESIDSLPPIPKKRRLKISTLKSIDLGQKIGELFIKLSVKCALKNKLDEIYLTHFTETEDYLVNLITEYGFKNVAKNRRGEDIYLKEIFPDKTKTVMLEPREISKKFYPCHYDGQNVNKFIVPIQPRYHDRLFIDYKGRQSTLLEHFGEFIIEGNTIKKAYLCHSPTKMISPGDIIIFYRSKDLSELSFLGVVEDVFSDIKDKDKIMKLVSKRTVYPMEEIEEMVKKPTLVILFMEHFSLKNPLNIKDLKELDILSTAPQSITRISHEKYLLIKNKGGIDERFTVN